MSDLYCDDCGERLRWRITPRGNEATFCPSCYPDYETDTAPVDEYDRVEHLIRDFSPQQVRTFTAFDCPNCNEGPDSLRKFSRKTNHCELCETSYPIYD